jgi:hypothetical protein
MDRLIITIILLACGSLVKSQNLHLSAGIEKPVTRCLYGGALTYETKGKWGIGGFYQTSISTNPQERMSLKDAFYGVIFQVPLAKSEKISFFATARLGLVNENFFVAVPGLETSIKTWKKLNTVFNMGYRVGYPSIGIKLSHPIL